MIWRRTTWSRRLLDRLRDKIMALYDTLPPGTCPTLRQLDELDRLYELAQRLEARAQREEQRR